MKTLVLIALVLCSSVVAADRRSVMRSYKSSSSSTLNNGLVSYWKLDEASGNRADSHGNNTLADNATVASDTGKIGDAALFVAANSEFLSKTDDADFAFTTGLSVSWWMYRDTAAPSQCVYSKWADTQTEWFFDCGNLAGLAGEDLSAYVATSLSDPFTGCAVEWNGADQSPTTWYHMVLIYDGSLSGDSNRLKLYQDGNLLTMTVGSGAVPASLQNGTADFQIGNVTTIFYGGRVDEFGLWNRPLTSGEVALLYGGGSGKAYPF